MLKWRQVEKTKKKKKKKEMQTKVGKMGISEIGLTEHNIVFRNASMLM